MRRAPERVDGPSTRLEATSGGGGSPRFDGRDLDGDREAFVVRRHVKVRRGTA